MVTALSDGAGLHTTELGTSGPRLVFCHGLFGQGKNWTGVAKQFAADHRVLLVDMPDHGRSAWSEGFDYLTAADRVAELFGDEPVRLVGHSMGGKTAMILALRHPELVERLCVVDVSPVPYEHGSEFAGYISAMQAIDTDRLTSRGEADAALTDAVPNAVVRGFLLQNLRHEQGRWFWQANLDLIGRELPAISGWPEADLAGLAPYDGPVLWIGGQRSDYVTDEYAEPMDRWFPRNRRVIIKGAGHWVHSEQPAVFVQILRRFLDV